MSDEREQFEQLFRDNYDAVYRFSARRVPIDAVQDVVAETFLAAWRRHHELRGTPLPWLLGTARRVSANHLRGDGRRGALQTRLDEQPRQAALASPEQHPTRISLALSTLPARDREALILTAWDGLEHRVAANVMGCSTTAFTVRLHRARHKLQRALDQDEESTAPLQEQARSTS